MNLNETDILFVAHNPANAELAMDARRLENLADNLCVGYREDLVDILFCRGGIEVLKHITADPRTRDNPVVIPTSFNEEQDLVRSALVNCYIQSVVDFEQFRQTVRTLGLNWIVVNPRPAPNGAKKSTRQSGL